MIKAQRLEEIRKLVNRDRYVSNETLMKKLSVSRTTLYRDLTYLDRIGEVCFERGGVSSVGKNVAAELPLRAKKDLFVEEKKRIAAYVVSRLQPGESIFIDSGSTAGEVARLIGAGEGKFNPPIRVITNDLLSAMAVASNNDVMLTVIGGDVNLKHCSMQGYFSEAMIAQLKVDKLVLGIDGVSVGSGLTGFHAEVVASKKRMLENAREKIALADHSKFEQDALITICALEELDLIVTGKEIREDILKDLLSRGVKIVAV